MMIETNYDYSLCCHVDTAYCSECGKVVWMEVEGHRDADDKRVAEEEHSKQCNPKEAQNAKLS